MRLYEFFLDEYTTKSGDEITFRIKKDIEGDNNRGWQVDQIDAYVKGRYAGYLKIAYIPKERFKKWYPSILNFLRQIKGSAILPIGKEAQHYSTYTDSELKDTFINISWQLFHKDYSLEYSEGKINLSREELLDRIREYEKQLEKEYKDQLADFKDTFVDHPYVDFIRVFKRNEPTGKKTQGNRSLARKHFKRQRIGTALYLKGAEFLKKKGLLLRASTSQSDSAQDAWVYLEKQGLVLHKNGNRYIDPNKVP